MKQLINWLQYTLRGNLNIRNLITKRDRSMTLDSRIYLFGTQFAWWRYKYKYTCFLNSEVTFQFYYMQKSLDLSNKLKYLQQLGVTESRLEGGE